MGIYFTLAYLMDRRSGGDDGRLLLILWAFCLLIAGFIAWRLYRLRRAINRLTPADELVRTFGISPGDIERIASERGAKPQYNINGVDYYDARDLGDTSLLLHPASAPADSMLLHPLANRHSETDRAELLHASEADTKT